MSSLLGLRDDVTYEGEAAAVLEAVASRVDQPVPALPWRLTKRDGLHVYDPVPTLNAVLSERLNGTAVERIAAAFHTTLVEVTVALCVAVRRDTGLDTVCVSGGVFTNGLLTGSLLAGLRGRDFRPYTNERVPTNDGGISYGQAAVAAARIGGG